LFRVFQKVPFLHAFCRVVQQSADSSGTRSFCVLVVDDDASIRRMIIAALRREGYRFLEAANGREALDFMRAEKPDVVVLDLMMPMVSGWDVLRERVNEPSLASIPVIIVSANRDAELSSAIDKGICAFLPKPFDIGALSALVRSCVQSEAQPS
jgi:two-component system, chemotaxis family, chemotaxis protein CheY